MALFEETNGASLNNEVSLSSEKRIKKTLSYRYVVFGVAAAAYFFGFFQRMSASIMAPNLVADFGIDPAQVGLFGSMFFYGYALSQLPSGILADRWGARKTMSLFMLVAGIATLLFGLAGTFGIALSARFLVGLGIGFLYVSILRTLADWFLPSEYATYTTILVAIGNTGALAASAPFALLIAASDWRTVIIAIGVITLIIAILLYLFVRNKPEDIGGAGISEIEATPAQPFSSVGIAETLRILFGKYNYWVIMITFGIWLGTVLAFQGLWAGPYLMNVFHLSQTQAGNMLMLLAAGAILGLPLAGFITDRVLKSPRKVVIIGFISYIAVWVPLAFFGDVISLNFAGVLLFLFGFVGYSHVILWPNLKENVDPVMLGTASGIVNLLGFVCGAIYQQVLGVIIGKVPVVHGFIGGAGFKSAFMICFVSLLIAFAVYLTQRKAPRT